MDTLFLSIAGFNIRINFKKSKTPFLKKRFKDEIRLGLKRFGTDF
jgi:hypothetical protein